MWTDNLLKLWRFGDLLPTCFYIQFQSFEKKIEIMKIILFLFLGARKFVQIIHDETRFLSEALCEG